jgi:hypothetical protein
MSSILLTRRKLLKRLAGLTGLALVPKAALSQADLAETLAENLTGEVASAKKGTVLVRLAALLGLGPGGRPLARVDIPETSAPVLGDDAQGAGQRLLWQLMFEGRAAGNHGDLYENRDRGHSTLPAGAHPQLTHVVYDDAARKAGLDYGLAGPVIFEVPVIGNSSTAIKSGPFWRSLPRKALLMEGGPQTLYQNYLAGQMHVYPEHRDHDPEHGDLIPANTPYLLISQGSSGSDRGLLRALAMILAALRPETKAFLLRTQLLAPTVQMILRRSLTSVRSRQIYLTGLAHPSVIPSDEINLMRMVQLANALTPDMVPPMVRLSVLSETKSTEGIDYFGEGLSERIFDTPAAIARLWRGSGAERSMIVSVEATRDPNGGSPDFDWRVLRGDPARTRVEPLDARGLRARITVGWQLPRPVPGRPDILSSRVDIGVFARSGPQDSTPGLISILLPQHETRRYGAGPDGALRIESIDRRVPEGGYADPAQFPRSDWRDVYRYGPDGMLLGWDRDGSGARTRFDAAGRMIAAEGPVPVRHMVERDAEGVPRIALQGASGPKTE